MSTLSDDEAGRVSAMATYVLYLLSIPSAGVFALIGLIVAYATRDGAGPLAASHLDEAVRIWWVAFWWAAAGVILAILGFALAIVLIGIPLIWLAWLVALIGGVWFTVKSLLGLLRLLDGRPA